MTPSSPGRDPGLRRLRRLADDPATLPDALQQVWGDGDAAVVAPCGAPLPAPIEAALADELRLPPDTALVVPTSGSTGEPRAVVLAHRALAASTAASLAALGCQPGERWALALPLRHVAGLQVLARARALGSDAHVVADPGDPHAIAAAADHAEHIALVPTQLVRCLEAGAAVIAELARFRTVLVGGGPLDPAAAAQARAAGVRLVQSYGMTETCGGCVYDGRALDGVEVALTPDGRIRLRGPMLATGYLGSVPDEVSTEDAARFTPDGWFVTDDLGELEFDTLDAGRLRVRGRADDVIVTGGVKVVPAAVEAILREFPEVADVVVLGVADAEWGERVRAVVVAHTGDGNTDGETQTPSLASLRAAVTARLGAAHAPRDLVLVERISRDGLGKVSAAERARLAAALPDDAISA